MREKKVDLMVAQAIYLPAVPNYVRLGNGQQVDVATLSKMQLEAIGKAWTCDLIEHAHQRRRLTKKTA